jgi:hypothetical protein
MSASEEVAMWRNRSLDTVRELGRIIERLDRALFDPAPPQFPLGCPYTREEAAERDLEALREELGRMEEEALGPWSQ